MSIIRRYGYRGVLMKSLDKVKKRHVSWYFILTKVWDEDMKVYFFNLLGKVKSKRKRSTNLSQNRCAYNTLRHFYSTTTTKELLEKICYEL